MNKPTWTGGRRLEHEAACVRAIRARRFEEWEASAGTLRNYRAMDDMRDFYERRLQQRLARMTPEQRRIAGKWESPNHG